VNTNPSDPNTSSVEDFPSPDITNQVYSIEENPQVAAKYPKKKYIILGLFALLLAVATSSYFFLSGSSEPNQSLIQKISSSTQSLFSAKESAPSPPPSQSVEPSIEDIIKQGGYQRKEVDFTSNDGPSVEGDSLEFNLPKSESSKLVKSVQASELQLLRPIYFQNPSIDTINQVATQLGIKAKATKADSNKLYYLEYTDPEAKLTYDPSGGTLYYDAKPTAGTLPTFAQAEEIVRSLALSLGWSLEGRELRMSPTGLSSIYDNFATNSQAIAVNVLRRYQNLPVVYSDVDHFIDSYNLGAVNYLSPEITIILSGNGKISRLSHISYAQHLATDTVSVNNRTLQQAISELMTHGGHVRNLVELEGQRTYFGCADNSCRVYNATITKASQGYYWNNILSGLSFFEINDNNPRALDYLMPVWIFEGTGLIDKSITDESGRLKPNPDRSNPDEYYAQAVNFTSTIVAFDQTQDVNILRLEDYSLSHLAQEQAKVTFDVRYLFPSFPGESFAFVSPRFGVRYKLLILFPDNTYSIIEGHKPEIYPGEITFDLGAAKGTITTYLELPDFSNVVEKRTLEFE
jgi:hypothetical protein